MQITDRKEHKKHEVIHIHVRSEREHQSAISKTQSKLCVDAGRWHRDRGERRGRRVGNRELHCFGAWFIERGVFGHRIQSATKSAELHTPIVTEPIMMMDPMSGLSGLQRHRSVRWSGTASVDRSWDERGFWAVGVRYVYEW
jgi:hypothetical protein